MSNILRLVRIGFLPPTFNEQDLKKTIYYKIWESFRTRCIHAEIEKINDKELSIKCKQLSNFCDFNSCPILGEAIEDYEKETRSY